MRDVIHAIVDDGYFFEVHEHYAKNIVVGFARLDGRPVGIVANQPAVLAGVLDIDASDQGRALRPLLRRVQHPAGDVRGRPRLPARARRRSTAASSATAPSCCTRYAEATVPKVTVITRKAYGGAYCVMSSKHIRTDVNFAWPTAEIAVMGPEGAVNILYKTRARRGRRSGARASREGRGVPREVRHALRRARPRLRRRGHRSTRHAGGSSSRRCAASRTSATRTRPRSTGTSRSRTSREDVSARPVQAIGP